MRYAGLFALIALTVPMAYAPLTGQTLSSVSSRWSDSFVEWDLYEPSQSMSEMAEDERTGILRLRWLHVREDFTEWEYEWGTQRGNIRLKWRDDPNHWELRTFDNEVVTMRTLYPGDMLQWRVTNNNFSLELRSKWGNQVDEWLVDDRARGMFYMYTYRERDPRDWVIDDRLSEDISQAFKMALVFLCLVHGSPRM